MVCGQCPLILDRTGLNVSDITQSNTIGFAIDLPNAVVDIDPVTGNPVAIDPVTGKPRSVAPYTNEDWRNAIISIKDLEDLTKYDFLTNLPGQIQNAIKNRTVAKIKGDLLTLKPGFLMAATDSDVSLHESDLFTSIWHNTSMDEVMTVVQNLSSSDSIFEVGVNQNRPTKNGAKSTFETGISDIKMLHTSASETCPITNTQTQVGTIQIGIGNIGSIQERIPQTTPKQIGTSQVGFNQNNFFQIGSTQANSPQVSTNEFFSSGSHKVFDQFNSIEVALPSTISLQQLNGSNLPNSISPTHDLTSNYLTQLQSTLVTSWHLPTDLNITFNITNLPTGQLAEGTITSYNTNGTPKTATITIDDDANGVGWFIDTTPQDNSEFTGIDNYLQATPNSPASGKYDLLTAILHEMGHTLGIINGYSEFDKYVKGSIFTTDTFTTKLTPDGSHLNSTLYPYDLMNTSLKPGVRKLPSSLDLSILNTIWSNKPTIGQQLSTTANLTAGALIGITNGDFTTPTTWNTAGASNIINGTATLTEQSQKLSELTQAFIIPTGASRLQFTIVDNHLIPGDTTKTANDAFEVALLDTNTFTPLAGTSIGLNHTDSLLNIQANGTIFKSDKVLITNLNNKQIVTIDVSDIAPNTQATLYFNLIGFGAKTSTITIDDVILSSAPPTNTNILKPDQIQEGQSIQFQATETIPGINNPNTYSWNFGDNTPIVTGQTATHTYADNGTYKVALTFAGIDGVITTQTAAIKVDNVAPTVASIVKPDKINEGQPVTFSATATDPGILDTLTYSWNFGDNTAPVVGKAATHTFADNGDYNVILTVTDKDGGVTSQTITAKVDNVIPNIASITQPAKINEGQAATFSATATDPGIKDTLTYTWNFGDNTPAVTGQSATHTYADNGDYNLILTVTDKDGGVTSQTTTVKVDNIAPAIVNISKPTTITEGQPATFSATVTDPGIKDTLTYSWNFGDSTNPATGKSVTHTFADNGNYNVILTVTDKDGGVTNRTIATKVDNVAPTIVNIEKPTTINKGQAATFTATATDVGILDTLTYSWNFGDTTNPILWLSW
jgi:PKD repeat protein